MNLVRRLVADRCEEMGNECGKCRTWKRKQYWNGEHSNKHRFFKIMLGDFRTELRIPRKFKLEFKGELLDEVNLRGPSGNIWTAKLVDKEQDFFLGHCWDLFVKDHGLIVSDFLVFEYSARSCFDVLIFDATGCEKEGSYSVVRHGNSSIGTKHCCSLREAPNPHKSAAQGQNADMSRLSSSDDERDETQKHDNFTADKFHASLGRKQGEDSSTEKNKGSKSNAGEFIHAMNEAESVKSSQSKKHESKTTGISEKIGVPVNAQCSEESSFHMENVVDEEEDQTRFSDSVSKNWLNKGGKRIIHLASSRRDITREEEIAVLKKAKTQSSGVLPSCLLVMKPSHVSHGFTLTIPKWFADAYLPEESKSIELRVMPGEKSWQVQFNRWKKQCTVNKGWAEFVLNNNLEVSDVCVLSLPAANQNNKRRKTTVSPVTEMTKKKTISVLNVFIYRVVEDIVELKVI